MRIFWALLIFLVTIILTFTTFGNNVTLPRTYLNEYYVGFLTPSQAEETIGKLYDQPLKLKIKDRIYTYTFKNLGIQIDKKATINNLFAGNQRPWTHRVLSLFEFRRVTPVLIFSQDYFQFVENQVYDFGTKSDQVVINDVTKQFIYQEKEQKYRLVPNDLNHLLTYSFGSTAIIRPTAVKLTNEKMARVRNFNQRIAAALAAPIQLSVSDASHSSRFTIQPDTLKQLVALQYDSSANQFRLHVDNATWDSILSRTQLTNFHQDDDRKLSTFQLRDDLVSLINTRLKGNESNTLIAKVDYQPNTDGKLADKYIEADISQQRLYLFTAGKLYKSFRISTGYFYPTPTGQFKILNKANNAFSDIYQVWMPYWMAFGYDGKLNAYFGIHELPYTLAEDGSRKQSRSIGKPSTGGCIALDVGQSKEVYDFADVGTPVYIYN